jgi:hypothetical protein
MPDAGPVVSNSGPLVALSLIRSLDLLRQLYGSILIPSAVHEEVVVSGAGRPGSAEVATAAWIRTVRVEPAPDPMLSEELGPGEAEAIALSIQVGARLLLMDDRRARRVAELAYGLLVHGAAGILVRARRKNLVPAIRPLLLAMRDGGYHLSDRLIESASRAVSEG